MKLIVGLGNPGEKYKNNRHNVGFLVLDELKTKISNFQFPISNQNRNSKFKIIKRLQSEILRIDDLILAKPLTFMNNSGVAVKKLISAYCLMPSALYVIHDDLDIPLGKYKIQVGKGPELHGGINSIEEKLSTPNFTRIRVGVDRRDTEDEAPRPYGRGIFSPRLRQVPSGTWLRRERNLSEAEISSHSSLRLRSGFSAKGDKISGEEYVLQDFTPEEKEILEKVIDAVIKDLRFIPKIP